MSEGEASLLSTVASVRRFSRFYSSKLGLLDRGYLNTPFSLTEARVIYELAGHPECTAKEIGETLEIDPGYLSRILGAFDRRGIVNRRKSPIDGRETLIQLTSKGLEAFATLNERSRREISELLAGLTPADRGRLKEAVALVEGLLERGKEGRHSYRLRPPRSGDLGWVVSRQGILYAQEYGWNSEYEALVAEILSGFFAHPVPADERAWIAEIDGEIIGSVFCVRKSRTVAQLRLLYVEPRARGKGIGKRLVDECIDFARAAGYRKIILWTNDVLVSARRIYEGAGFHLVKEERHHSFGKDLVGQFWEKPL